VFGNSHSERAGLLDYDALRISNCLAITGTVFRDVTKVRVRKLSIEKVECCMPRMENKGLATINSKESDQTAQPLGTFVNFDITFGDKLDPTFRHKFGRHAFDMHRHCYDSDVFYVSSKKISTGSSCGRSTSIEKTGYIHRRAGFG